METKKVSILTKVSLWRRTSILPKKERVLLMLLKVSSPKMTRMMTAPKVVAIRIVMMIINLMKSKRILKSKLKAIQRSADSLKNKKLIQTMMKNRKLKTTTMNNTTST